MLIRLKTRRAVTERQTAARRAFMPVDSIRQEAARCSGPIVGEFGSPALPSLSPLTARPLPDNLPYRLKRYRVLKCTQVSGFTAFGRGQDCSAEDFT
jgi:hypothetical protein